MAKLDRKDVKIFAENSDATLITEFRTEDPTGETASFSRDPDVIQNENYSQGWVDNNPSLNTKIYGEDLNAVNYVLSYLLKYLYENGIAEWNSTTTYYENSIVKSGSDLYISLEDDNTGNNPTSTVNYWKLIPTDAITTQDAGIGYSVVKALSGNEITFKTISVSGYGTITDNGDQLNINIAGGGGGGGGDAFWGMIQGTLSNQTDLVNALNAKQNTITCSSPLTLDSNNDISIPKATTSVSGYLDYQDWNTFNGKQNSLSFSTPLSETSGTVSISKADTSTSGYLDYNDWNTFNNKQNAINALTITETSTTFDAVPKSSTTTSNIGSLSYPFSNLYTSDVYSDNVVPITVDSNDYNSQTLTLNNLNIKFKPSSIESLGTKLYIDPVGAYTTYLGFNNAISFIKVSELIETPALRGINGSSISVEDSLIPSSTNKNLGSALNPFYEGYISYIKTAQIKNNYTAIDFIEFLNNSNAGHYVNYNAGTDSSNYGAHIFKSGGNTKFAVFNDSIKSYVDILPDSNDTYCLGTNNSTRFKQLWINEIHMRTGLIPEVNPGSTYIGTSSAKIGDIYCTRINGSTYNPSDRDKKENIVKRNNETKGKKTSLEIINFLDTYTYNYKNDEDKTIHIGIMAQDLAQEIPECVVDKGNDNAKGEHEKDLYIDVMGYVTVLTEAVKELNDKVKTLEARIEELEGKKELEK